MENLNLSIAELEALLSKKKTSVKQGRAKIEEIFNTNILEALNNARKEVSEQIELGQIDDSEICTKTKYFSIGINFNHKVKTNKSDKSFVCNVQHRTKAEYLKAQKKQDKDEQKTIKLTSEKKRKTFEQSQK